MSYAKDRLKQVKAENPRPRKLRANNRPNAKLSRQDVTVIRSIPTKVNNSIIAGVFGVSVTTIWKIRNNETWLNV